MTIEEWFVKEHEKAKKAVIEMEKKVKEAEIDRKEVKRKLNEVAEFLKGAFPRILESGHLHLSSFHLDGEEKERAERLLKKLGIGIERER